MAEQEGANFEANFSRVRLVVLALLAFGFVALGLWMLGAFGPPPELRRVGPEVRSIIAIVAILFFGACGVVILWRAKDAGLAVRIDRAGIYAPKVFKALVPWEAISAMGTIVIVNSKMLGLELADPDSFGLSKFQSKMAGSNRSMTGFGCSITLSGTTKSHSELISAVKRFAPGHLAQMV